MASRQALISDDGPVAATRCWWRLASGWSGRRGRRARPTVQPAFRHASSDSLSSRRGVGGGRALGYTPSRSGLLPSSRDPAIAGFLFPHSMFRI